jgi:hypothetical protein
MSAPATCPRCGSDTGKHPIWCQIVGIGEKIPPEEWEKAEADIKRNARKATKPNKKDVPDGAKYLTMDRSGAWKYHWESPEYDEDEGVWESYMYEYFECTDEEALGSLEKID